MVQLPVPTHGLSRPQASVCPGEGCQQKRAPENLEWGTGARLARGIECWGSRVPVQLGPLCRVPCTGLGGEVST